MCGIVGVTNCKFVRKYLIEGLKALDYRGYDSAGIATIKNDKTFEVHKVVGKVEDLDASLPKTIEGSTGIGHTRWATHGAPTLENCHPHHSSHNTIMLVHNGVIENYRALKVRLMHFGYTFYSDTDTEVIANLIEYNLKKYRDILAAIRISMEELQGSFACAFMWQKDPAHIYFMKRSSPLLVGLAEDTCYIASDAIPMTKYTDKFIDILDDQYGFIGSGDIELYKGYDKCEYQFTDKNPELLSRDLNGYENYMLKEIEETPAVLTRLVDNYFDGKNFLFDKELVSVIRKAKEVVFIACGTSYHASLQGVRYMHYLNKRSEAYIASEWAYYPVFGNKNAVYVLISQSGETADLIRCQKIINSRGLVNVAITNTKGSTIDREATFSCLLYAGLEVAVASTKAFSAQVSLLALLVGAIEGHDNVIYHLQVVKEAMYEIITRKKDLEDIASEVEKANMLFFIGRGNDLDGVKEAALKMKEISYIHSEAFPGGELKHGPIAIVDKDTSTIAFISEVSTELAIRANVKEIEARGAKSFVFAAKGLYKEGDAFAVPMCKNYLAILPMVYCGQYLSYYVALHKGVNIDKPRNLAKSVTVE